MIDYAVVVLKGVIEKDDAGAYFGSFGGLVEHIETAVERGWIEVTNASGNKATEAGWAEYRRRGLIDLPRVGRAYLWRDTSRLDEDY